MSAPSRYQPLTFLSFFEDALIMECGVGTENAFRITRRTYAIQNARFRSAIVTEVAGIARKPGSSHNSMHFGKAWASHYPSPPVYRFPAMQIFNTAWIIMYRSLPRTLVRPEVAVRSVEKGTLKYPITIQTLGIKDPIFFGG